jgi:3-oxoacyl-[acyl-carrier protein] reductase
MSTISVNPAPHEAGLQPLQGRIAIVTGGTTGLGRAIATAYRHAGALVLCGSRSDSAASWIAAAADPGLAFYPVDVRSNTSVEAFVHDATERFGDVDLAVSNAGIARDGLLEGLEHQAWRDVFATNVEGAFNLIRAVTPSMERAGGGRIITMSSAIASRPTVGAAAYGASKAALEALTKTAALELADRSILVNALAPGYIAEGMGARVMADPVLRQRYGRQLAAGRLGIAEEIAQTAVFLASGASSYVNGHVLEVNGGLRWA